MQKEVKKPFPIDPLTQRKKNIKIDTIDNMTEKKLSSRLIIAAFYFNCNKNKNHTLPLFISHFLLAPY